MKNLITLLLTIVVGSPLWSQEAGNLSHTAPGMSFGDSSNLPVEKIGRRYSSTHAAEADPCRWPLPI